MAQVQLYKRLVPYTDKKDGKDKTATNFFLQCGNGDMIAVDLVYYKYADGRQDKGFGSRKAVLSAFADDLPDKPIRNLKIRTSKVLRGAMSESETEPETEPETDVETDADLPF